MNHDLKSIQQKQIITKTHTIKASTDYYLNERGEPPQYKMITSLNDILKIETTKDTKELYIVPENNNLTELFFDLVKSGYEPRKRFQAGITTEMKLKFNKVIYTVKLKF